MAAPVADSYSAASGKPIYGGRIDPAVGAPGALPVFGVTSAVGGTSLPFALGHVFAQGDVPAGSYVTSDLTDFEVEPRNTWSDGSLRFAVLKGRATLAAGTKKNVALSVTSMAPSGTNIPAVTSSDVGTTNVVHSTAGTVSLADAIAGVDLSSFTGAKTVRPASAGKVRSIPGTVMTEEHFYAPFPSHGHLCVFWHVRKYKGGRISVETVVEQGWARVESPAQIDGTVTVNVNGSETYSAALKHRHHNRWSRTDWIGGDPQIMPSVDTAYWRGTTMIPNYMTGAPSSAALDALVQTAAPMTRGPFDVGAAGAGSHPHIGLMAMWDAMVITSNCDPRAYAAMLVAEQAANCCNLDPSAAGFVWRDEITLQPIRLTDFANESLSNNYSPGYGANLVYTGSNTDAYPWTTDGSHGCTHGYLAYLLTGRWFSLETVQMNIGAEYITWGAGVGTYQAQHWMREEDRAQAWMLKHLSAALATAPSTMADVATYRSSLKTYLEAGMEGYIANNYSGQNTLGIPDRGGFWAYGVDSTYAYIGCFQDFFVSQAFPFAHDLIGDDLGTTASDQLKTIAEFYGLFPVGMAGTRPGGYCYTQIAHAYTIPVANIIASDGSTYTWLSDMGAVFDALVSLGTFPADSACAPGGALLSAIDSTSYLGNFTPALAKAVDMGVDGAADAWARYTGASNFAALQADFADHAAQWGIVPR